MHSSEYDFRFIISLMDAKRLEISYLRRTVIEELVAGDLGVINDFGRSLGIVGGLLC